MYIDDDDDDDHEHINTFLCRLGGDCGDEEEKDYSDDEDVF